MVKKELGDKSRENVHNTTQTNEEYESIFRPYVDLTGSAVMSDTKYKTMNVTDTCSRSDMLSKNVVSKPQPYKMIRRNI